MLVSAAPTVQISRPNDYSVIQEAYLNYLLYGDGDGLTQGGLKGLLSIDFPNHDTRLRECLAAAIDEMERYTGRLLLPAVVTVTYLNLYDLQRLPYGGSTGTAVTTDLTGLALTLPTAVTDTVMGYYPYGISLTYAVGYEKEDLPRAIREALLWNAANSFDYGNRNCKKKAMDYRLSTWAS